LIVRNAWICTEQDSGTALEALFVKELDVRLLQGQPERVQWDKSAAASMAACWALVGTVLEQENEGGCSYL
jgi:hypothetical protein